MSGKQNMIFFLGLVLIVMVFWINGYWSTLKSAITKGTTNVGSPNGNPVKPVKGKCPPGYMNVGGTCFHVVSPNVNGL